MDSKKKEIIKFLGIKELEDFDFSDLSLEYSQRYKDKGVLVSNKLDLIIKDPFNINIHNIKSELDINDIAIIDENNFDKLVEELHSKENVELDVAVTNTDNDEDANLSDTKVGELLYKILFSAKARGVSDIHIVPKSKNLQIKYRVDGKLVIDKTYPREYSKLIINKIKNESDMDIFNTQTPQDGKLKMKIDSVNMEFRVSTLPTIYGENAVMRAVNSTSLMEKDLTDLGFNSLDLEAYREKFAEPYGMILNVGATGAGKTTTFYLTLNELVTKFPYKNICTVEDPVEIRFDKVLQIQVEEKVGRTFPVVLKSLLRQDPDIILIGEMRDEATSEIAVRSALTGHLVLSTLHANDTFNSITRLRDLGISDTLLSSTLTCLLSQRLSRKLCSCKEKVSIPEKIIEKYKLNFNEYYIPKGCPKCDNTGFKGRSAIIEVCIIDEDYKIAISSGRSEVDIKKIAREKKFRNLWINGLEKVKNGIISLAELESVVNPDKIINN